MSDDYAHPTTSLTVTTATIHQPDISSEDDDDIIVISLHMVL